MPRGKTQKVSQLLGNAKKWTPQGLTALANYVVKEQDYDIFSSRLDDLDAAFIPEMLKDPEYTAARKAGTSLMDLVAILQATDDVPRTEAVEAYRNECLRLLVERWTGVTKWMAQFILNGSRLHDPQKQRDVQQSCVAALCVSTQYAAQNPYMTEIASHPYTLDVLFMLLRQTENSTGLHFHLQSSQKEPCQMLHVLILILGSSVSRGALRNGLNAVSSAMRNDIISSLVKRGRQLLSIAEHSGICGAVKTLLTLLIAIISLAEDRRIWRVLTQHNFMSELTASLRCLMQRAVASDESSPTFWEDATNCITSLVKMCCAPHCDSLSPGSAVCELLEAGIVTCITASLPYQGGESLVWMEHSLRTIFSQGYLPKVNGIVGRRGDIEVLARCLDKVGDPRLHGLRTMILDSELYADLVDQPSIAGAGFTPVNLCSNLRHTSARSPAGSTVKICARCHSVSYCSAQCQTQDWREFHFAECDALSKRYSALKSADGWPPTRIRAHQLRFLEAYINSAIVTPHEVNQSKINGDEDSDTEDDLRRIPSTGLLHRPNSALGVLDNFTTSSMDFIRVSVSARH